MPGVPVGGKGVAQSAVSGSQAAVDPDHAEPFFVGEVVGLLAGGHDAAGVLGTGGRYLPPLVVPFEDGTADRYPIRVIGGEIRLDLMPERQVPVRLGRLVEPSARATAPSSV